MQRLIAIAVSVAISFLSSEVNATPHSGLISLISGSDALQTCALMADHRLTCWGNNQSTPSPVDFGGRDVMSATLGFNFGCAVMRDGTPYCWGGAMTTSPGNNEVGQLGDARGVNRTTTAPVLNGFGTGNFQQATLVAAGGLHACAVKGDSSAWCWGSNSNGQIGNFNAALPGNVYQPNQVRIHDAGGTAPNPMLTGVKAITAGSVHSCALLVDNTAACWGGNWDGELGNGQSRVQSSDSPQAVVVPNERGDLVKLTMSGGILDAGQFHTCGLIRESSDPSNNSIACWGANGHGQLGNGSLSASSIAVAVKNAFGKITNAVSISMGYAFSCVLISDGTVNCWGSNDEHEIGRAATGNAVYAVPMQNSDGTALRNVSQIVSGANHACVLTISNSVYCWGDDQVNQLGPNAASATPNPTLVPIDSPIFTDNLEND